MSTITEERIIRGIPAWLMGEYLKELGMVDESNACTEQSRSVRYSTPAVTAHVEQIEDFVLISLRVGQIRFVLEGEETAVDELKTRLEVKLLRGGG